MRDIDFETKLVNRLQHRFLGGHETIWHYNIDLSLLNLWQSCWHQTLGSCFTIEYNFKVWVGPLSLDTRFGRHVLSGRFQRLFFIGKLFTFGLVITTERLSLWDLFLELLWLVLVNGLIIADCVGHPLLTCTSWQSIVYLRRSVSKFENNLYIVRLILISYLPFRALPWSMRWHQCHLHVFERGS